MLSDHHSCFFKNRWMIVQIKENFELKEKKNKKKIEKRSIREDRMWENWKMIHLEKG